MNIQAIAYFPIFEPSAIAIPDKSVRVSNSMQTNPVRFHAGQPVAQWVRDESGRLVCIWTASHID